MDKFSNTKMYAIPTKEYSNDFIKGINYLRDKISNELKNSANNDFVWINPFPLQPSFHNLSFRLKNQVFSVLLDLGRNEINSSWQTKFFSFLDEEDIKNQIKACEEYNLIPCKFRIDLNTFTAVNPKCNLISSLDNSIINPSDYVSEKEIKMSDWEINNFAIQIVLTDLQNKGIKIDSYCDLPGIEPQIWFTDENNNHCWILVKYINNDMDDDYHKWQGLQNTNKTLTKH